MTQNTAFSSIQVSSTRVRSFFPYLPAVLVVAALLAASVGARAQDAAPPAAAATDAATPGTTTPAAAPDSVPVKPDIALSNKKPAKVRAQKADKVVQSKDTKVADKKAKKITPIAAQDAKLPDQQLYEKAQAATNKGHYDVARLEYQDLLNTYQESQYLMRAKLGIADSWFQEGGTAALTQAEQEYTDFITFFPNAPEAAEAQMRIGDIYYRQMDKPDRDYANTIKAEAAYRQMLQQFPDSTLVPQAKQRLRDVQEALAMREANIADFYASHMNWSATIARDQTVVDTYPLYSHLDDVVIGLGDAFESEARGVRASTLPEAAKAQLLKIDEDQATAAYDKVVLEHSAATRVEDAKDRLLAMGRPVPTPTPEQMAASEALENSRGQYTLSKRMALFVLSKADTVPAATIGDPPLEDAKPTLAPTVLNQAMQDFANAMNPATYASRPAKAPLVENVPNADATAGASANAPSNAAPLAFQDVTTADTGSGASPVVTNVQDSSPASASTGGSIGIEIVQPSADSPATSPASASPPAFPGSTTPDSAQPAPASDSAAQPNGNGGIQSVGPPSKTVLAPIEKAAEAPDTVNQVTAGSQPPAQLAPVNGKKTKPAFDKADESSSKHKKKKGVAKLNPF